MPMGACTSMDNIDLGKLKINKADSPSPPISPVDSNSDGAGDTSNNTNTSNSVNNFSRQIGDRVRSLSAHIANNARTLTQAERS